ncbi:hypothetical protein CHISP_0043 [Chitinispirillum alkaliphilum]|nr:hypothetical protein CHISP_0043 [Chitinispirillum alkaliphilum]
MRAVVVSDKESVIVQTPTATAGIRGSVFRVDVENDSSTDVLVYQGTVVVRPEALNQRDAGRRQTGKRQELEGPEGIEGPREVTLEDWITIVAGQQLRVDRSGSFSAWHFDRKRDAENRWVNYNT